jgi:hypothetical protein
MVIGRLNIAGRSGGLHGPTKYNRLAENPATPPKNLPSTQRSAPPGCAPADLSARWRWLGLQPRLGAALAHIATALLFRPRDMRGQRDKWEQAAQDGAASVTGAESTCSNSIKPNLAEL